MRNLPCCKEQGLPIVTTCYERVSPRGFTPSKKFAAGNTLQLVVHIFMPPQGQPWQENRNKIFFLIISNALIVRFALFAEIYQIRHERQRSSAWVGGVFKVTWMKKFCVPENHGDSGNRRSFRLLNKKGSDLLRPLPS